MTGHQDFRLDESVFPADQLVSFVYDDYRLDEKTRVRRVVFKASGVDMNMISWSRPRGRGGTWRAGSRPANFALALRFMFIVLPRPISGTP